MTTNSAVLSATAEMWISSLNLRGQGLKSVLLGACMVLLDSGVVQDLLYCVLKLH